MEHDLVLVQRARRCFRALACSIEAERWMVCEFLQTGVIPYLLIDCLVVGCDVFVDAISLSFLGSVVVMMLIMVVVMMMQADRTSLLSCGACGYFALGSILPSV